MHPLFFPVQATEEDHCVSFKLSKRSLNNLNGVHPDLVKVVKLAITYTPVDFVVTEGLRTKERQAALVKAGASRTMTSRHLTGHAVDVAALVGNEVRWDWPLYERISQAFKRAAKELKVKIVWGGDWPRFRDGPHYELARSEYPVG
jgi:peptidoglycan LD-endopeptidase CwlK